MKKPNHILATCTAAVLLTGTLIMPGLAPAQVTERTTTTTTSTGTLAEFGPEALVVRSETSPDPIRYTYSDKTVYVDATGAAVSRETLRSGAPLTVHYTKVGGTLVAERVIIGNLAGDPRTTTTTRTTTTSGTIADFGPGAIAIRTESAPEPLRYTYGETTTYVDETGAPVSIETVRSGLPVTVHYTQSGDRMVATRVVVRRSAAAPVPVPAPAPVIEERRTTTTTTTTPKPADDDDDDGK